MMAAPPHTTPPSSSSEFPHQLSATHTGTRDDHNCQLFSIRQFECSPAGGKITCWPLERVFRRCGGRERRYDAPVVEVTSQYEG